MLFLDDLVDDLPRLVPAQQAAEFLGISTRTLRRWITRGLLQALKTSPAQSGRVRVPRSELLRLLSDMAENY